jgi:hypothetical protein
MATSFTTLWATFKDYWYSFLVIPGFIVYGLRRKSGDRAVFERWARSNSYTVLTFKRTFGGPISWQLNRIGGATYRFEVADRPGSSTWGWVQMPFFLVEGHELDMARIKWDTGAA